ncbi:YveK family protein [Paenibacillus humicola]|uniref:YveK family protein n=1 Tax=Paenibacillus humicola TaxID=3110540 RepID=UPI00237B7EDA|nr:Wzz/FepE/Etk N-terminal domain-containing protein [Paenibacillus humicola]
MNEAFSELNPPGRKGPVKEINVKEIVHTVKKRYWLVVISTLLFVILGTVYSSLPETPLYASSARMVIRTDSADMLSTLKVFSREPVVMEQVIQELNLHRSPDSLRNQIRISSLDNSLITLITAIDPDPKTAADIANAAASAFADQAASTFSFRSIQIITKAEPDPTPINPRSNRAIYIGLFAGIALGIGLTFLLDSLDDSVKSSRDIERLLGLPVLGTVQEMGKKDLSGKNKRKRKTHIRGETIGS